MRGAALAAVSALTVSTLAGAPAHAAEPAPTAAAWMAGELTNGLVYNEQFTFNDIGLSADFAFALADIGGRDATVNQIVSAIEPQATSWYSYTDTSTNPATTTIYAGSLAKAAALAQVSGRNARAFGGVDLVTQLEQRTANTGAIAGRIEDLNNSFGDANVIGQAFAVRALTAAGSAEAGRATSFLLAQQCAGGYFRGSFTADKTSLAQACADGGAGSAPDTDTTALALIQLAALQSNEARVKSAIERGAAWLASRQQADGSLTADAGEPVNANSTGLAAWALGEQGSCLAAGRAATWVRGRHLQAGTTGPLAADIGAVAYDQAALTAAQSAGITSTTADQWRRATAQAAPALASTLSTLGGAAAANDGFVKAGTTQWISLTGASAGDSLCVTGPDNTTTSLKATAADFRTQVAVPDETGEFVYRFASASGERTVTFSVLDSVKIKTKAVRKKVTLGKKAKIRLTGLEAGEKVKLRVGKKVVDKGKADAKGRFVGTFKVTKKIAKSRKKLFVKSSGQFAGIRKGFTTFRVLR